MCIVNRKAAFMDVHIHPCRFYVPRYGFTEFMKTRTNDTWLHYSANHVGSWPWRGK